MGAREEEGDGVRRKTDRQETTKCNFLTTFYCCMLLMSRKHIASFMSDNGTPWKKLTPQMQMKAITLTVY